MHAEVQAELGPLLVEGRTCWKRARADRIAFIVDVADYFEAFIEAIEAARRSVLVLAWDIDSRERLRRGADAEAIGTVLERAVRKNRALDVRVLGWSSFLYAFEREKLSSVRLGLLTPGRLHYRLDSRHSLWASQHQKAVVIDDRLAFVGGMDLTSRRWDTPEHRPEDPRRVDPAGKSYGPFHDVMIAFDGPAAACLGHLARERWRFATGERISAPEQTAGDPWPALLLADVENATLGIARTVAEQGDRPPAREIEALYLESIRRARRRIYFENQYVTVSSITDAILRRLQEPEGPEIVMVLPGEARGMVAENSMGELRVRTLAQIRAHDPYGRFRAYSPVIDGRGIYVHGKVMIADDRLLRIGSANLNNRCMGLDTECDVALEALPGETRVEDAITAFQARLLAEHLGLDPAHVRQDLRAGRSITGLVAAHSSTRRGLIPIEAAESEDLEQLHDPDAELLDPARPYQAQRVAHRLVPTEVREPPKSPLMRFAVTLLVMLALAGAWRFTPLGRLLDATALSHWAGWLRGSPLAILIVPAAYVVGGFLMAPLLLLIVATALTFTPLAAASYALLGAMLSACAGYAVGRAMGKPLLRHFEKGRVEGLRRRLLRHGFLALVMLRLVPIAPYTLLNMLAGVARVRFWPYVSATLIGLVPGTFGLVLFGYHLGRALKSPGPLVFSILAGAVLLLLLGTALLHRWLGRPRTE
jgi:phosphatidylserine/phosphatidylglycerophosphate/cardiolipin synthase-like enzyme/uncharacterized membrane protein YdjX (TVP38/TMEM64 family)